MIFMKKIVVFMKKIIGSESSETSELSKVPESSENSEVSETSEPETNEMYINKIFSTSYNKLKKYGIALFSAEPFCPQVESSEIFSIMDILRENIEELTLILTFIDILKDEIRTMAGTYFDNSIEIKSIDADINHGSWAAVYTCPAGVLNYIGHMNTNYRKILIITLAKDTDFYNQMSKLTESGVDRLEAFRSELSKMINDQKKHLS